jgi:FKBP-type peptidyl-prolyl cis-trans isomerase
MSFFCFNRGLVLLICFSFLFSCGNPDAEKKDEERTESDTTGLAALPFQETPNGLKYHFHSRHDGPSPDSGDVVRLEILLETPDRDLMNTFVKPEDYYEQVKPPAFKGDMVEILPKVSKGDSLTLRMPASQLYKGRVPPQIGYYDTVFTRLKVINFFNEKEELLAYIADKNYEVDTLQQGLYQTTMEKGTGNRIGKGDSVVLDLVGYLMDGQPFQRTREDEPMTFTYGEKDLLKGLKIGLKGLKPDAHVRLFMTSDYGYGEKGARPYIIPFSPLIYDLKVKKVIPSQAQS